MSQTARVTSLEAVRDFRAALCRFAAEAGEALMIAEMEIRRTSEWLDDQAKYWKNEIRLGEQRVAQAQADLRRRRMSGIGDRPPDCTDQEKALRIAKERLRHAEDKAAAVLRWGPLWQKAVSTYEGPARRLAFTLEGDMVNKLAMLDGKLDALDSYVALSPSSDRFIPQQAVADAGIPDNALPSTPVKGD